MAISVKHLVRKPGALPAAITGFAAAVVMIGQQVINTVIYWVPATAVVDFTMAPPVAQALLSGAQVGIPFGIGMFLSLWIVAPIAEELRVGHVISRSVLAAGIGSTLVFVSLGLGAIFGAITIPGTFFGNSFPLDAFDQTLALSGLGFALTNALATFITNLPLGVLGGVLLWTWRKSHPPEHPLSGLIDL